MLRAKMPPICHYMRNVFTSIVCAVRLFAPRCDITSVSTRTTRRQLSSVHLKGAPIPGSAVGGAMSIYWPARTTTSSIAISKSGCTSSYRQDGVAQYHQCDRLLMICSSLFWWKGCKTSSSMLSMTASRKMRGLINSSGMTFKMSNSTSFLSAFSLLVRLQEGLDVLEILVVEQEQEQE
jgi:hypothetical protein